MEKVKRKVSSRGSCKSVINSEWDPDTIEDFNTLVHKINNAYDKKSFNRALKDLQNIIPPDKEIDEEDENPEREFHYLKKDVV